MAETRVRFIEAAGGVLWRPSERGPEVAVIHRPKYDDWSLPKGKLHSSEHPLLGALREVEEETGFVGRPGRILGEIQYLKDGAPKRVHYWAMQAADGSFASGDEVDELCWLSIAETRERLNPDRDRPMIDAFASDVRATTPCIFVRHASAGSRGSWDGDDNDRPLDDRGIKQAGALAPVLAAFGVERILSASVVRCVETVAPFAAESGVAVEIEDLLSEHGYRADPHRAAERVRKLVTSGEPVVLCSQGEAISPLLETLCADLGGLVWQGPVAKGAFVALHVDADNPSKLVAVDVYPPAA